MLILKAFHIVFMVSWFGGLFYLPRLFVYHADSVDRVSIERFQLMEKRLYYGIMWPAALLTSLSGLSLLLMAWSYYSHAGWMHIKLTLVALLWAYHLACGHYRRLFAQEKNERSALFFRFFNEIAILFLVAIVFLVVLKP